MQNAGKVTRVVILGGGFGGVYTARHLEKLCRGNAGVQITLVSRDNYFLITPLLFEAGSGVLEPRHAVSPIRPLLKTTRFIEAEVQSVDVDRRLVRVRPTGEGEEYELPYDHLVLALGGVASTHIVPGAERAMTFKTLGDAISLRNHVIESFEWADVERDPARKAAQLTFVIVGGGYVGVELMGELTTFIRSVAKLYKNVDLSMVRFEMVEAGPRIAPEFEDSLSEYAADVLQRRAVRIRLNTRVKAIHPDFVELPDGEQIRSRTIIAATGVSPNPLVATLPIEKSKRGHAVTEPTMRLKGRTDVWAIGDCASIPDPSGKPYPPLAQHALREASLLAENLDAVIRGGEPKPFVYRSKGSLAALGHFKGAGEVYGINIRGFVAWWVWRSYYLLQMPRWSRRLRVVIDWTTALLFKNDVVQLDVRTGNSLVRQSAAGPAGGNGEAGKMLGNSSNSAAFPAASAPPGNG